MPNHAQLRPLYPRPQQPAVPAGNAHGAHAVPCQFADHSLVYLAAEDHFHHFQDGGVRNAQAVYKAACNVQAVQQGRNLRPAPVHQRKVHALGGKLGKVGGKGRL